MKKISTGIIILGVFLGIVALILSSKQILAPKPTSWWKFESIDTMKFSRDLSREKLHDPQFVDTIEQQMKDIKGTGASYVAIATPYDEEFYPILRRWVESARRNNLKVWFRGNFSGWEGWFDYPRITRSQHLQMTKAFIKTHSDIFKDGDIFTACPECENGGPGDPRATGDVFGHRKFLKDEYEATKSAFGGLGLSVTTNYNSMNADVAKLIMDSNTTRDLGGVVAIDHYVKSAELMNSDINYIADKSGGKIILGEFGAPISDITGEMTEGEQQLWLEEVLSKLASNPHVIGVNYWVNTGGSTELWSSNGKERLAVASLRKYFKHESN